MEKCSKRKKDSFTMLDNEVLRDVNLSFKAKGLLCVIMGLPDTWDFTVKGIAAISTEGETAVRSTIKELKDAGYCDCERHYENGKIKELEYYFSDSKTDVLQKRQEWEKAKEKSANLDCKNLHSGNLNEENLNEDNRAQLNNEINNNKEENKETLNISVKKRLEKKYNNGKELTDKELKYYVGMEENYPRVMRMDKPLLYCEYLRLLKEKHPVKKITAALEAMEDWKPIHKHTSALRQLRTFMKRDKESYELQMMFVNG